MFSEFPSSLQGRLLQSRPNRYSTLHPFLHHLQSLCSLSTLSLSLGVVIFMTIFSHVWTDSGLLCYSNSYYFQQLNPFTTTHCEKFPSTIETDSIGCLRVKHKYWEGKLTSTLNLFSKQWQHPPHCGILPPQPQVFILEGTKHEFSPVE